LVRFNSGTSFTKASRYILYTGEFSMAVQEGPRYAFP